MEYLELVLLITAVVALFRQTQEKAKLEDKIGDIEGKLNGIEKLLIELQPKGPVEIPARLDDEIVNVIMDVTKQDMEEYQVEKTEFQEKMKEIKEKYKDEDDIQYEGTEHDGGYKINKEQIQEILENIKYRKANRLK